MLIKVIAIFIGSMIFPAIGYYLDWRDAQKRRGKKPATRPSATPK